jgi:beta-glucanase (GH16 family)
MKPYKKMGQLILLLALVLIPFTKTNAQSSFKKLVWSDEFNKPGLPDSTKWGYDIGRGCPDNCGWGNHELQYYTNRAENARVENGRLIITARKETMQDANYTSTRLVSKNKGDWKYGRIEVKAKLPAGRGMWPAVWMLPTKWEYGGWPHSGEIDIMENVGYWPDSLIGTVHTGAFNGMKGTQKTKGVPVKDLSTAFHVYAIDWTADVIRISIDNKVYNVFKNEHKGSAEWPFDKEFHLLLNIAVGGDWGGKYGVDDSIFPQKMEIDYVRVYQ